MSEWMTDDALYAGADAAAEEAEAVSGDPQMRSVGRCQFWRHEALRARRVEAEQQDRIHALEVHQAELIRQSKEKAGAIEALVENLWAAAPRWRIAAIDAASGPCWCPEGRPVPVEETGERGHVVRCLGFRRILRANGRRL